MAVKISILLLNLLFFYTYSYGQTNKVDSLLKALSSSNGEIRVDCLNSLSEILIGLPDWFNPHPTQSQLDSAELFNKQALQEAHKDTVYAWLS